MTKKTTSFNSSAWEMFGDKKNYSSRYLVASWDEVLQDILHPCFLWAIEGSFFLEQNKLGSCTHGEMKLSELFVAILFIRKHQYGLDT